VSFWLPEGWEVILVIVAAADERYVPHFAALLHSVWSLHPEAECYLLDCGTEAKTLAVLTEYATRHHIRLTVIKVDVARLAGLPTPRHWSAAIYARLLIPELLPLSVQRALYLDADCMVVGDLVPFWNAPIMDAAVAGVLDTAHQYEHLSGINTERYISSGVLLMNLTVWRRDNIASSVFTFVREQKPAFPDQTAINVVCADRIHVVGDQWNAMTSEHWRWRWHNGIRIVHFTGFGKPWLYRDAPFSEIYLHHRNRTPFALAPPQATHRRPAWRRAINLLACRPKYWRGLMREYQFGQISRAYFENAIAPKAF